MTRCIQRECKCHCFVLMLTLVFNYSMDIVSCSLLALSLRYVQYVTNLTSSTAELQIAHADQGPLEPVIRIFEESFSTQSMFKTHTEETRDWDVIYPFSQFLESYTIPVPFNRSLSIEENQAWMQSLYCIYFLKFLTGLRKKQMSPATLSTVDFL